MGRKRYRPVVAGQLPKEPTCPWCAGRVLELVDNGTSRWECEEHGWMDTLNDARIMKTSLGDAVVVHRLEQLDENPALLASGLPVFLEDELARLKAESPEQRKRGWQCRIVSLAEYAALKATLATVTVSSPWRQA